MSDLTDFILARIAEDEAAARACAEAFPPPWDVNDRGHSAMVRADAPNFWPVSQIDQEQETPGRWPGEHLEHIARHDPARVLARCAADRQIVEATRFDDAPESVVDFYLEEQRKWAKPWPLRLPPHVEVMVNTLRALASAYADHPDYREEWAL